MKLTDLELNVIYNVIDSYNIKILNIVNQININFSKDELNKLKKYVSIRETLNKIINYKELKDTDVNLFKLIIISYETNMSEIVSQLTDSLSEEKINDLHFKFLLTEKLSEILKKIEKGVVSS